MNNKINIYVSMHKDFFIKETNIIKPVCCGSYKDTKKLCDSTGENISDLNKKFCELTTMYWAWKNQNSNYYGFFHYRRFLSFDESEKKYEVESYYFDDETISKHHLNDETISNVVNKYDLVIPKPSHSIANVYRQYKKSPGHNIEDFEKALKIILQKYPEYKKAIKKTLKKDKIYFFNMFIMKKEIFNDFCNWLFPILFELDKQIDWFKRDVYSYRAIGFVAERLFNIYLTKLKMHNKNLKIKELPILFIKNQTNPYPTPTNNSIPVVLACDNNYAKYAGAVIESVLKNNHSQSQYEFFIVSNSISDENKSKLNKLKQIYKTINSLTFIDGDKYINQYKLNERSYINKTTFLRLGILDFMRNYKKAIYLDCDIIVNDDLSKLFSVDIKDKSLAAALDTGHQSFYSDQKSIQNKNCEKIGIKNKWNYFNAGILLMNIEKMRQKTTYNQLIKMCVENKYFWQDQDCLNVVFEDDVKLLDIKWNCFSHRVNKYTKVPETKAPAEVYNEYLKACENPSIVHYAGKTIPTFCNESNLEYFFWKNVKNSIFYEDLLREMTIEQSKKQKKKITKQSLILFIKKHKLLYKTVVKIVYFLNKIGIYI